MPKLPEAAGGRRQVARSGGPPMIPLRWLKRSEEVVPLGDAEGKFEGFVEPETFGWRCVFEEEGASAEVLGHDGQDDFVDEVSADELLSDGGPAIAPDVLPTRQAFPPTRPFKEVDGDVGWLGLVCGNDMKFPFWMRIRMSQTRDHFIRRPPSEGLIHARHKLRVAEIAPCLFG